jgi:hypothetical protein
MPRRNLPPVRVCACGRRHRAYALNAPCPACRAESLERSAGIAEEALRQRLGRSGGFVEREHPGERAAALTAGTITQASQARRFLDLHGGSFRAASKRLHPDVEGGSAELFGLACQARDVLAREAGRRQEHVDRMSERVPVPYNEFPPGF